MGWKSRAAAIKREVIVYRRVIVDPRTPRAARWLLALAVAYLVSPIDLIPDFIPVLGHLDDLVIVPLLVMIALTIIDDSVVEEHRRELTASNEAEAERSDCAGTPPAGGGGSDAPRDGGPR